MKDLILALVLNNALWAFIQFMITRHDKKSEDRDGLKKALADLKQKLDEFSAESESKMRKQEKDSVRTQLLVLISLRPDEEQEILTLGEHYFKKLKGNWYMTSIFSKWLTQQNVAKPGWFNREA